MIYKDDNEAISWAFKELEREMNTQADAMSYFKENGQSRIGELKMQRFMALRNKNARDLGLLMMNMTYDGVLNKNQY